MAVHWERFVRNAYQESNPTRLKDVSDILLDFRGYEEALWLDLSRRYKRNPNELRIESLVSTLPVSSTKQRVIRMYARYVPSKLKELDVTLELCHKEGVGNVFDVLEKKYGDEPVPPIRDWKERALAMYASYGVIHRMDTLDQDLKMYEGLEDHFMRRLENELGIDPTRSSETEDSREPRQRLKRILTVYDPLVLGKVEVILSRYQGKQVELFSTMQRRYGREPTELDVQIFLKKKEDERRRREEEQLAVLEAQLRGTGSERKNFNYEIVHKEANSVIDLQFMEMLPGDVVRDESILAVRTTIETLGDKHINEFSLKEWTHDVYKNYDRDNLKWLDKIISSRFDSQVEEAPEFLSFLDCFYTNAHPHSSTTNLREIVSLQERKFGTAIEAVWQKGGVDNFLAGIEPKTHPDWAIYLIMMYGRVTEAELATRNRLRAHYMYYNPMVPKSEVENILKTFEKKNTNLHDALTQRFGPEPDFLRVDKRRVWDILRRNAPDKIPQLDTVIMAHTDVGDSPEDVVQNCVRTYGPEPSTWDNDLHQLMFLEHDNRFRLYAHQIRMRDIIYRRFTAMQQDGLQKDGTKADALLALIEGEMRKNAMSGRTEDKLAYMMEQEGQERNEISEDQEQQLKEIVSQYVELIDYWDRDNNVELAEMLGRLQIIDESIMPYPDFATQRDEEESVLGVWLAERLPWRRKWAEEAEKDEQSIKDEFADQKAACLADLNERDKEIQSDVTYSQQHHDHLNQMYEQIRAQSMKVLMHQSAVTQYRRSNQELNAFHWKWNREIPSHRPIHHRCRFKEQGKYHLVEAPMKDFMDPHNINYNGSQSFDVSMALAQMNADDTDEDWLATFQLQCEEYLEALFEQYETDRVGTAKQLLEDYRGKESQLISALEQQYNVNHWRGPNLKDKLIIYYDEMAPSRHEEIDFLLTRFQQREEQLWEYVTARYGPAPSLQTKELRMYLRRRLQKYLAKRASHLREEADIIVTQCKDNGESIFLKLTKEFGPEDPDEVCESLERRLRTFYAKRKMPRSVNNAAHLARRFVGRERLLKELLNDKFGDDIDSTMPDVADHAL